MCLTKKEGKRLIVFKREITRIRGLNKIRKNMFRKLMNCETSTILESRDVCTEFFFSLV